MQGQGGWGFRGRGRGGGLVVVVVGGHAVMLQCEVLVNNVQ